MAVPSLAALLVLVLRNAGASEEDSAQLAPMVDVVLAYALAFLTQPLLSRFVPALALPHWYTTEGGIVGPWFLVLVRALCPPPGRRRPQDAPSPAQAISAPEIGWLAEELRRQMRLVKWAAWLGAAALAGFGLRVGLTGSPRERAGCAWILAGSAYLALQFLRSGSPETVPAGASLQAHREAYRRALVRQHVLLQRIRLWFYAAPVPGLVLTIAGTRVYHFVAVLVVLLIAELVHRAGQNLEHEIGEFAAAEAAA